MSNTPNQKKNTLTMYDFISKKYPSLHYNPYPSKTNKTEHKQSTQHHPKPYISQTVIKTNLPKSIPTTTPPLKQSGSIRICYINTNGIKTKQSNRFLEITNYMKQHDVDVFALTEINVNLNKNEMYKQLLQNLRKTLQQKNVAITAGHTNIPWKSSYKPGGVMIITNEISTSNTISRSRDHELGRWVTVKMGPQTNKIAIITAYVVGNTELSPTKLHTIASQQWQIMSIKGINGHPRGKTKKIYYDTYGCNHHTLG